MKIAELTGPLLDAWVARSCGMVREPDKTGAWEMWVCREEGRGTVLGYWIPVAAFRPSTDPAHGQPIIERAGIATWRGNGRWHATMPRETGYTGDTGYIDVNDWDSAEGPTPLIAAMRAYVASKFGDEVPDEPGSRT